METFKILNGELKQTNVIIFSSTEDLRKAVDLINKEEDFIVSSTVEEKTDSELIISANISAKVKNGEIKLKAFEVKRK